MKTETQDFLFRLHSIEWFGSCLAPLQKSDIITVASWAEATRSARGRDWMAARLQMKNFYASSVVASDYERSTLWNPTMAEVRARLDDTYSAHIQPRLPQEHMDSKDLRGAICWDVGIAAMQVEFSDTYPPVFYLPELFPLYAAGRFPCGREGIDPSLASVSQLPPGRLFVL